MNRVEISGSIAGLAFHEQNAGVRVGRFILCHGDAQTIPVIATRSIVLELEQFQEEDFVSVSGKLFWEKGVPEILAENIRQWTSSVYRKTAQQDKFPRQIKGMKGVPIG
jgi:hypothetical protein